MTIEEVVRSVENRLMDLGHRLFTADAGEQLQDTVDSVRRELAVRRAELQRLEAERDAVRERLQASESVVALLPSSIQSSFRRGKASQAWRQALELDRARRTLAENRRALPRLDQVCWSLGFLVRQLERHLRRLQGHSVEYARR